MVPRDSVAGEVEAARLLIRITLVATLILLAIWFGLTVRTGPAILAACLLIPGIGGLLLLAIDAAMGRATRANARAKKYMGRVCPPGKLR